MSVRKTLRWLLEQPFPAGWIPQRGERVAVPSVTGRGGGYTAYVERVRGDIVRVRVAVFRLGRQDHMLENIRPCHLTGEFDRLFLEYVGGPSPCRQPEMPDQNPEPENGRGEQAGRLQEPAEDPGD